MKRKLTPTQDQLIGAMKTQRRPVMVLYTRRGNRCAYRAFEVNGVRFLPRTIHALYRKGLLDRTDRLCDAVYTLKEDAWRAS